MNDVSYRAMQRAALVKALSILESTKGFLRIPFFHELLIIGRKAPALLQLSTDQGGTAANSQIAA